MKLKQFNEERKTGGRSEHLGSNEYIQVERMSKSPVYIPDAVVVFDYLSSISPPLEELLKQTSYDPMGAVENRLYGPAAFIADPKGFGPWVRSLNLPSSKEPTLTPNEIESSASEALSMYLSGRPDDYVTNTGG